MSDEPYSPRGLGYVSEKNFLAVNRSVVRALGLHAAVLIGELADKARYFQSKGKLKDGWFFMTVEHIEWNTGLGERAQRSAIETLKKHGILEVAYRGSPRKRWFRIDAMKVIDIADDEACDDDQSLRTQPLRTQSLQTQSLQTQSLVPAERSGYSIYINKTDNKTDNTSERPRDGSGDNHDDVATAVIEYLNERAGTNYRPGAKGNRKNVNGRLSEGYTLDDFRTVIDRKCRAWLGDPRMRQYLRPATLFSPEHFDAYLNEPDPSGASSGTDYGRWENERDGIPGI